MRIKAMALIGAAALALAGAPPAQAQRTTVCNPLGTACLTPNADGSLPVKTPTPSYTVLPAASSASGAAQGPVQSGAYLWDTRGTFAGATSTLQALGADGNFATVASQAAPGTACVVLTTPQGSTTPNVRDALSGATGTPSLISTLTYAPQGCAGAGPSSVSVTSSTSTNGVVSFQQTTTTSAAPMPANSLANGLIFTALATNTGKICVGGPSVTLNTGYCLSAGQSASLGAASSSQAYMVGSNATDVLQALGN